MAEFDRRASSENKAGNSCSQCGVPLGKLGLLHNKRHVCHTCDLPVCAACSQYQLPDSSRKLARACKSCWEKAHPQVDYRVELEASRNRVKELAGYLETEKQGREYDRALFRTEADSHRLAVHRLEKEAQSKLEAAVQEREKALEQVKASFAEQFQTLKQKKKTRKEQTNARISELQSELTKTQSSLTKLQEQLNQYETDAKCASTLLEDERRISDSLREQLEDSQKQLNAVKEYHATELSLVTEDFEETIKKLNGDLAMKEEALQKESAGFKKWKQLAKEQCTLHEKAAADLSQLRGEYMKLQSRVKAFEESEQSLLSTINSLKSAVPDSEMESELVRMTLQLKETSTHASALEAENRDFRNRIIPELQKRVSSLTIELEDTKAAAESEERERVRISLQLQEALKKSEDVRRELSKKTHAEMKAMLPAQNQQGTCISCLLM